MKKVLVIVVTYNGLHWLNRCLGSVAADADLFVVDNNSADGSADFVESSFPQARLIRSTENTGFAHPNNMGMEWALEQGYDYVYLLNQDAWLEEGALGKMLAAAEAHPEYAVLSPLQMKDGYDGLDVQFAKLYNAGRNEGCGIVTVPRVMAAHWLVSVAALRRIGLFNESLFPMYGQDDDWCNRARYHGFQVGVVPEARAVHDRAWRKEALGRVVFRNYYVGSLVRLVNPGRPLSLQFLYVCLFTAVKTVKYRSILPIKYFRAICRLLPELRATRARAVSPQLSAL